MIHFRSLPLPMPILSPVREETAPLLPAPTDIRKEGGAEPKGPTTPPEPAPTTPTKEENDFYDCFIDLKSFIIIIW